MAGTNIFLNSQAQEGLNHLDVLLFFIFLSVVLKRHENDISGDN